MLSKLTFGASLLIILMLALLLAKEPQSHRRPGRFQSIGNDPHLALDTETGKACLTEKGDYDLPICSDLQLQ